MNCVLFTKTPVMIPLDTGCVYALAGGNIHFQFHFQEWPRCTSERREAKCNHRGRFYSSVCVLTILGRADNIFKKTLNIVDGCYFSDEKNIFINVVCSSWLSIT
jgi:hypothetical protein